MNRQILDLPRAQVLPVEGGRYYLVTWSKRRPPANTVPLTANSKNPLPGLSQVRFLDGLGHPTSSEGTAGREFLFGCVRVASNQ